MGLTDLPKVIQSTSVVVHETIPGLGQFITRVGHCKRRSGPHIGVSLVSRELM